MIVDRVRESFGKNDLFKNGLGEIPSSSLEGIGLGLAGALLISNVLLRVGIKSYYNWARSQNIGTFHNRMALRIDNSWINNRFRQSEYKY